MRTPHEREDALREAVRGIELDADEELMLAGFARSWPATTVERVCSLLEKVREAGYLTKLDDEAERNLRHAPQVPRGRDRWIAGNSGPGF